MDGSRHDLVIGGSGMLSGLVERLAQDGRQVSVIARGRARLQQLAARHPGIHPLPLDYRDAAALDAGLASAVAAHGALQRCVAWMHDDSRPRALRIGREIQDVYCEVLGSASADPAKPEGLAEWQSAWRGAFGARLRPVLRLAVLGFRVEAGGARWLTDAEISTGVGRALESTDPVSIVGSVTPWSARP